jgi:hypothetical protein
MPVHWGVKEIAQSDIIAWSPRSGTGMAEQITFLSFEEWVRHMFDHEASGPQWYYDAAAPFWMGPADLNVEYITRLFEEPVPVLSEYSDAQLNQGFWYLVSNGGSDCMFALIDESVPLEKRVRCLKSFKSVFQKLFATRCSPHLSHLDEPGAVPLNSACYMWWDIIPLLGQPGVASRKAIDHAALEVMADTLTMDSIACQESALHGLGHWQLYYPSEAMQIIDVFLSGNRNLRPELINYAKSARCGCVQ